MGKVMLIEFDESQTVDRKRIRFFAEESEDGKYYESLNGGFIIPKFVGLVVLRIWIR